MVSWKQNTRVCLGCFHSGSHKAVVEQWELTAVFELLPELLSRRVGGLSHISWLMTFFGLRSRMLKVSGTGGLSRQ